MKPSIGKNISVLYRYKTLAGDIELKKFGLSKIQGEILLFLNRFNGSNQTTINKFFLFNKASITRMITHLEENNFVTRETDESDRREKSVFLTQKAYDTIPEIRKALLKSEEEMLKGIPPEEQELVRNLLDKMAENIQER